MKKIIRKLSATLLIAGMVTPLVNPGVSLQAKPANIEELMGIKVGEQTEAVKTFVATQDAFIHRGSPDKKYGVDDAQRLIVKSPKDGTNPPSSTARRSYIEFDLSQYPEDYVQQATFKVCLVDKLGTTTQDTISIYETANFDESQITWNTAPAETGVFITSGQVDKTKMNQYVEFDVTDYINAKLLAGETDEPIRLMLKVDKAYESDQCGVVFAAKEKGENQAPVLEIKEGMPAPVIKVQGIEDESVVETDVLSCKISATSLGSTIPAEVKVNNEIVTPTGGEDYEIPLAAGENTITISATDVKGNVTTQRFLVKALETKEPIMSFQVIADTHISNSNPQDARAVALKNGLQEMKRLSPNSSGVFIVGDYTQNGSEAQYQGLMSVLDNPSSKPLAYYPAIGNHDVRWLEGGFPEGEERFLRHFNRDKVYYEEWLEGYQFIVLGTEKDLKDDAYISDEQMDWLEEKLEAGAASGQPIFVLVHQPLNVGFYDADPWNVGERDQELKHLFAKYPQVVYLSGHLHNPFERDNGPLFDEKYCNMIDVPSFQENGQGFFIDVYGDKLVVKGRDFNKNKWNYKATFELDLPADIPESDIIEPTWESNAQITAQADSRGCIDLDWSGATDNVGVAAYQILRNGMPYAIVDASTTSYKADKLFGGQTYTFTVQAKDAEGRLSTNGPSVTVDAKRDSVNAGRPTYFDNEIVENMMVYMDFDQNYVDQANNFDPRLRRGKIVYEETPFGYGAKYNRNDSLIIGDIDYGTEDFTVSYWLKGIGTDYSGGPTIISNKRFSDRRNPGWVMAMTNGGKLWYNTAAKRDGSKVQVDDQGKSNIVIANREWQYITVSTDRANNKVDIYKNGEKQKTHDISSLSGLTFNTQHPTLVGADGEGQNFGAFEFTIDELFMTKQAVSDEQAKAMYDAYMNPVVTSPVVTLSGDLFVTSGNNVKVTVGVDSFSELAYAQDLVITYDEELFDFVGAKAVGETVVADTEVKDGQARILFITDKGLASGSDSIELEFATKKVDTVTKSFIEVAKAEVGVIISEEAQVVKAEGTIHTLTLNPAAAELDKTMLLNTISEAKDLSDKAIVGTEIGQYPQVAKDALDAAILEAQQVADTSSDQAVVDVATSALRTTIQTFKESVIKAALEDINEDGKVDVADLALVAYHYHKVAGTPGWDEASKADVDNSGVIDITDLAIIAGKILEK